MVVANSGKPGHVGAGTILMPAAEVAELDAPDWDVTVTELVRARDCIAGNIVKYRWAVGRFTLAVLNDRTKPKQKQHYSGRTVSALAQELEESESTIYACARFACQTTLAQLERFCAKSWPWRAAAALVGVADLVARQKFQLKFESGSYANSDALKAAIKQHNQAIAYGSKTRGRRSVGGGRYTRLKVESFLAAIDGLTATLPEFIDSVGEYKADEGAFAPTTKHNIAALIVQARAAVEELVWALSSARTVAAAVDPPETLSDAGQ